MNPVISARGLTKRFGRTVAADHMNFEIQPGRIVGLIGPNGAGKTTALKAILGLTNFEGELSVLGKDPSRDRCSIDGGSLFYRRRRRVASLDSRLAAN